MKKDNLISALIQFAIVAGALFFGITYGNGIDPSDLSSKLSENVIIFEGGSHKPLLPKLPLE